MRVLLAGPRGFCAGVNMAIESLDGAISVYGPPVYVFHEIVHNRHVVERFRRRGAIFVQDVAEVPIGGNLVFSAHGVSPEVRAAAAKRQLNVIDATCPLVTKVHSEAVRFARQGHAILLIGHEGHDEIVGTMGEAPGRMRLVQSTEEADSIDLDGAASVAYLTQTTLSVDDATAVIRRLRRRFPEIVAPPSEDICYATQNRQEAVRLLAPECDVVIVIGSQNSSNSRRLAEIAASCGVPAHLVDNAAELDAAWFSGAESVLVTAGASAPEALVEECVAHLQERYGAVVEERIIRTEELSFQLPPELRRAAVGAR